jgi:hypothetical protein
MTLLLQRSIAGVGTVRESFAIAVFVVDLKESPG